MSNESRLNLELLLNSQRTIFEILEIELKKVNDNINRKFSILDEFSINWSFDQWRNWKDSIFCEISYREFLIITKNGLQK